MSSGAKAQPGPSCPPAVMTHDAQHDGGGRPAGTLSPGYLAHSQIERSPAAASPPFPEGSVAGLPPGYSDYYGLRPEAPVQRKLTAPESPQSSSEIHETASRGIGGSSESLPH